MDFDIKDVKSWANIQSLKIGDEGYFFNNISSFRTLNIDHAQCGKITYIDENWGRCFKSDFDRFNSYYFFLPLNAVKADKPEKRYRPFKTIAEVDELLAKANVKHFCFVNSVLYLRYKTKPNITKHISITNLEVDTKTNRLRFINSFTPKYLVKTFEIKLAGEWFPFGVEVKEND